MTDPAAPDAPEEIPDVDESPDAEASATSSPTEPPTQSSPAGPPASDDAPRGTVKWYSLAKGYGFLIDAAGGPDIFVHHSAIKEAGEAEPLLEGEVVEFRLEDTPRGRRARDVRRVR